MHYYVLKVRSSTRGSLTVGVEHPHNTPADGILVTRSLSSIVGENLEFISLTEVTEADLQSPVSHRYNFSEIK